MTTEGLTTEARMLKLVQRLHAKTQAGELQWEKTATANVFQAAFPSYVVRLSVQTGVGGGTDYYVSIRDDAGNLIEQASDVTINSVMRGSKVFELMSELYSMARRKAMGVDKALDSLLTELE